MRLGFAVIGLAALSSTGCVAPGMPMGGMGSTANSGPAAMAQYNNMTTSMAQAEAAARKPGDDALTCDQLQTEYMAILQDPTMRAGIEQRGAAAQAQMDKLNAARSGAPGFGGQPSAAEVAAASKQRDEQVAGVMTTMPAMMRAQRVGELGTAKKCAFMSGQPPR